jgi:hypothetical protein
MRGLVDPTSMKPRRHFDVVRAVGFCPHHALTKPFGRIRCRNPSDSEERVEKFREELCRRKVARDETQSKIEEWRRASHTLLAEVCNWMADLSQTSEGLLHKLLEDRTGFIKLSLSEPGGFVAVMECRALRNSRSAS